MKKRQFFYIAFILLLISGCTKNVIDILDNSPINKDGSVAFLTDSIISRGVSQNDLTAYDKVNLTVYSHTGNYTDSKSLYRQIVLNKSGSNTDLTWDYSPRMFWPEGHRLSFLAYAIESKMAYATTPDEKGVFIDGDTIHYSVPSDVTEQPDLLVTSLLNHSKVNNVTLPMKHALSCVSFCAIGPKEMKVKQISLKNVYGKGSLALDDPSITWTLDPKSKGVTAFAPGIDPDKPLKENPDTSNYLMTVDGYLMMIPQTLTDAIINVVYWKGTSGTEKTIAYTLPTTIAWEPGKKYIYKFGEATDEVVVYYEKYADDSYGFQSKRIDLSPLVDTKNIIEAGYGVLSRSRLVSKEPKIRLGAGSAVPTKKVESVEGSYNLYAVSQTGTTGTNTFLLSATPTPVEVYFDDNAVWCGKIIPHFAKGVSDGDPTDATYAIRTPQQMRNISVLTALDPYTNNSTGLKVFKQELDLDFSEANGDIGGGVLNGAVVDETFTGTYNGRSKSISNVKISAPNSDYIGLFSQNVNKLDSILLKSSSIIGKDYVGGIVGRNWGTNAVVNQPRIVGTADNEAGRITIKGGSYVGGIIGRNQSKIFGSTMKDGATEITVAEVSGWVNIEGTGNRVGGIVGSNDDQGVINQVLVNGVFVTGTGIAQLTESKITIKGVNYVGGITGQNDVEINGNVMGAGNDIKNMPDVAGIVEITGVSSIGGIAGVNIGKLNSVNIRLGRDNPMKITGTGDNVGGIVGENNGTLGVDSENTFISTRGNIEISGNNNVGGIVGNNLSSAELKNCFVYDFYSQVGNRNYYVPKITCKGSKVGGIAGSNAASISNCSVFSANNQKTLTITSGDDNAGGIVGANAGGGRTDNCSLVGKIVVEVTNQGAGGIFGDNKFGTKITNCWVGSSDGYNIIKNAELKLGLVIVPPGVVNPSFGTPFITGLDYIGGIVGLNDGGVIEGITLSDNVTIGKADVNGDDGSHYVGGIVGGNTVSYQKETNVIRNCKVINTTGRQVVIQGTNNLGGIVGLNNGYVTNCEVSGSQDVPLKITGLGTIGGIVGQNGGDSRIIVSVGNALSGNEYTIVDNCKVTGYVEIVGSQGTWGMATQVGGIVGLNGPNNGINNIDKCVVGGAVGSIKISVGGYTDGKVGTVGGIAGTNSGNINSSDVKNATISSGAYYAGGIAGQTSANDEVAPKYYRSNINDCRVYANVVITGKVDITGNIAPGALVGYLDSKVAIDFGNSTTPNQVNNRDVKVNGVQPTPNNLIVGFLTGGATLHYTVTLVSPR